jgi:hypothetical protein
MGVEMLANTCSRGTPSPACRVTAVLPSYSPTRKGRFEAMIVESINRLSRMT